MHTSILRRIWLNFMALFGFHPTALSVFTFLFRISNFFDLRITEETWLVEMRIWCIKIGIVLLLKLFYLKARACVCVCMWVQLIISFEISLVVVYLKIRNKYSGFRGLSLKTRKCISNLVHWSKGTLVQVWFWFPEYPFPVQIKNQFYWHFRDFMSEVNIPITMWQVCMFYLMYDMIYMYHP
jgi:hypothetical protein